MNTAAFNLEQEMQAAAANFRAGRHSDAETNCRRVLDARPHHPEALHLMGLIASATGRPDVAIELISKATAIAPSFAEAFSNLGKLYLASRQFNPAIIAFQKACSLQPNLPNGQHLLGDALHAQRRFEEAVAAYRTALRFTPQSAEVLGNLGNALQELGRLDEAITAHREALRLESASADAHYNLANALQARDQFDEAIARYEQALSLKPDHAEALHNLGNALWAVGQIDEAIAHYRRAVALDPASPVMLSNLVYAFYFHPGYDARAILAENREWDRRHGQPLKSRIVPHANERSPDRRLRIGYVSPDFREHVVGRNLLPLIREHDREKAEIFCYANVLKADALTEQLRGMAKGWRDIVGLGDEAAAEMIRRDGIDILVDLTLHMAHNRLPLFAYEPAPVQVTYLGYCGTTGLSAMDYRLSDPYLDPPGGEMNCYSEKTVRLPCSYWCYEPLGPTPEVSALPALSLGHVTFGCLNNFTKVSEGALELWMTIMREVPGSMLLLQAPAGRARQRVIDRFVAGNIAKERLEFVGMQEWEAYLKSLSRLDVALDPFPYGGGITSCDAIWMGVPVVTLSGETAVGRSGRSILSNIGLPELVAETAEEYVKKAVALASDLPRLTELRSSLRERVARSPLRDAKRHTRDIEAAFREMWRRWCMESPHA